MLGDVAGFVNGDRSSNYPSSSDFVPCGIPFINAGDIVGGKVEIRSAKKISQEAYDRLRSGKALPGDILFCLRGSLGKVGRFRDDSKAAIASSLVIIRVRETADQIFLYYFLQGPRVQRLMASLDNGSAQPNLSVRELSRIIVPDLTISEQRAIGRTLGALDDKIELNRKMSATLEAMARAMFKSWFVDFDPVRAKAEGRDIGLRPEIAALFPDSFKDSELGEIPTGWEVGPVSKIADVASGKRPPHRYPVKTPEHSVEVWGGNGPMAFTTEPLLNEPALLTGRVGTLGSVFRIASPIWPSDNTLIVRPHKPFFEYAFFVLLSIDYKSLNRGSTQPLLTQNDLKNQRAVVPSQAVVSQFSMIVRALFTRVESASKESAVLASVRDALLPKLISGEIRVTDAERIVAKSA